MEDLQDKQAEEKIKNADGVEQLSFSRSWAAAYHGHVIHFHQCSQNAQGQIVDGFIRYLFW